MSAGYSVSETARLLGLGERRVRQLVSEGRLTALDQPGQVMLDREQVHLMRDQRKDQAKQPSPNADALMREQIAFMQSALDAIERRDQRQIEARDRVEESLRDALAEAKMQTQQALSRVAELEEELRTIHAGKGWKKRKKRKG